MPIESRQRKQEVKKLHEPKNESGNPLTGLIVPGSVAVFGASPRDGALGNTVVRNLIQFGFSGKIFPIHPTASEVCGIPAISDIESAESVPDCAVVCLSADKVLAALEEAGRKGVRAAVIFASGFAEAGPEGIARQQALQDLARRTGMAICGPNCLGLANIGAGISLYSAAIPESLTFGDVAVLSHSGSGCIVLSNLGRFGISHMVSIGNGAVVDVHDYLDYLVDDPSTKVAALFIETIRNPMAFAAAVRAMRKAGKYVVALKVGRSKTGAAASAAHTGSLSGTSAVYDDFFADCGVVAVEDIDELAEAIVLVRSFAGREFRPVGKGVAILNVSGGEIALTCDVAERIGLDLSALSDTTLEKLQRILPSFATVSNPLDATGVAVFDMDMYAASIRALAEDDNVALVAVSQDCPTGLGKQQAATYRTMAETVARLAPSLPKPVVFYSNVAAGLHPLVVQPLEHAGVPVLQGARASLIAIRRLLSSSSGRSQDLSSARSIEPDPRWSARLASGMPFTERETKKFLAQADLPVTNEKLATSASEARSAADEIGYPVVLKIESPNLPHKSDVGGVRVGLKDGAAVEAAYLAILEDVQRLAPGAQLNGILVQEMVTSGVEMIVGIGREEPFGLTVVVGSGGVLVELMRDSALAIAPICEERAAELVATTRISKLLDGYRGSPPADKRALNRLVSDLSALAVAYGGDIEAIDLNPVYVRSDGNGVRIADALLIPRSLNAQKQESGGAS